MATAMLLQPLLRAACASLLLGSVHAAAEPAIAVDQVGFPQSWSKQALVVSSEPGTLPATAEIVEVDTGKTAFTAAVEPARRDPATGDWLRLIRFSGLRQPGRYRVAIGPLRSPSFAVGGAPGEGASDGGVYVSLERLLLRSFYLQRCGVALQDATTAIHHEACHRGDGRLPAATGEGPAWDATGGWHDAGDYGKYVATTAVSIGRILDAAERDPARFRFDDLGIPESGNGIPDVIDEMKVGLDWMLKMQRADGAVYRKIGGKRWPPKIVPEKDDQVRYVYGVTSPETAKAAAAWALAARLYRGWYPKAASQYLAAARKAWQWLEHEPTQVFDWREGDDDGSGPYRSSKVDTEASLLSDSDDRLWAATELAITTGEPAWLPIVRKLAEAAPVNIFEWKDASVLALSYLLWHPLFRGDRALAQRVEERLVARARVALANAAASGYSIANARFVWGSNKMTAEEGALLCTAYAITRRAELLEAARQQLHYVLGQNHFATSFVTGAGERRVRHPSHIFGEAANLDIPGLFVGGPNEAEQSNIAPRNRGALSWIDDRRSYATNEYAIDYDASLFGLSAALARGCVR